MTNALRKMERKIWLIAALVAHIVETQVGIATVSTHLLFWVHSALLIGIAHMKGRCAPAANDRAGTDRTTAYFLVGLAVLTLSFDFTETGTDEMVSAGFAWAFFAELDEKYNEAVQVRWIFRCRSYGTAIF